MRCRFGPSFALSLRPYSAPDTMLMPNAALARTSRLLPTRLRAALGALLLLGLAIPKAYPSDPVDLDSFKGKVIYLDFWASWCAPCRESFPFMNDLQQNFGPQRLVVIAVNVDRNHTDAEHFLQKHPARFRVIFDPQGVLARKFSVHGMPSSFVIDRSGQVQVRHEGFRLADREALEQQVRSFVSQN